MIIKYMHMPKGSENGGSEWMKNIPDRYKHGERGFDRRIMEELAAVDVPCYTVQDLANGPRSIPQGIPIFIDWLKNLETRIPGPETDHRSIIRTGLIWNLNDPAARGNQEAIDLLIAQIYHDPPILGRQRDWACQALRDICTRKQFQQIATLLDNLPPDTFEYPLIEYLGKVRTPESRTLAIRYLNTMNTVPAIKALTRMRATGVRHLIEPLANDSDREVRKVAKRALEKLPQ